MWCPVMNAECRDDCQWYCDEDGSCHILSLVAIDRTLEAVNAGISDVAEALGSIASGM